MIFNSKLYIKILEKGMKNVIPLMIRSSKDASFQDIEQIFN